MDSAAGRKPKNNIVPGTTAAGVRAIGVQLVTFYFRAPVKAFFRMRVDYMVCSFPSRGGNEKEEEDEDEEDEEEEGKKTDGRCVG